MKVRQSDIAAALGISRTTVARALNGSGYVDAETRKRIFELSSTKEYKKNLFASSLALKTNRSIHCSYVKTYNASFVRSMEAGFKAAQSQFAHYGLDFSFSSVSSEAPMDQVKLIAELAKDDVAALVIMPLLQDELGPLVADIAARGTAVVTLVMDLPESGRMAFVGSDNYQGGRIAAELYAKLLDGRGTILAMTTDYHYAMPMDRYRGFADKIAEYPGIRVQGPESIGALKEMYEKTRNCLEMDMVPDAVYTVTDISYVARAISDHIRANPHRKELKNIKLVAMDDDESARDYVKKGYVDAIVGQRPFIQAFIAAKLAAENLLHRHRKPPAVPRIEYDILMKENLSAFDNAAYFETIFRGL